MPSMPAACIRSAASAYLATMRSMSQSSASLGMARCAGSRRGEGATTGNQSSCAHPVRRPRWVSWIMQAAPCSWTSSVIRRSQGTISSRYACRLPKAGGLSSATTAEPAVMVMPMPPLAFSTWYRRYRSVGRPLSEYAGSCEDENTRLRSVRWRSVKGCSSGSSVIGVVISVPLLHSS